MANKKRPQKKRKIELVFDDKKRVEYLTGFQKRKQERRKRAKEELEVLVKEERKRVKQEIKDGFRDKLKKSFAPIPGLEHELNEEEYETEQVSVKIVELSTTDLANSHNWIGQNRPRYSDDDDEPQDEMEKKPKLQPNDIPGMGLTPLKPVLSKENKSSTKAAASAAKQKTSKVLDKDFKSKKELMRTIHKGEISTLKSTSKAFKTKQKLDRVKDRKKAKIERDKRIKSQNKEAKKKGGRVNLKKIKKRSKNRSKK